MLTESLPGHDHTKVLQQAVEKAIETKTAINISAGGSKRFYGRTELGQPVCVKEHRGVISYHPSELVITARTGTLLSDLERVLAEHGQMLAFEPPNFTGQATVGGVIASGLSGSRRVFTGSVRDYVLGCKVINGKAEVLSFGGETIKNVAGYDVSRLMVSAMGTLGLLLEVSLKVLPKPAVELTRCFALTRKEALARMTQLAQRCLPLSGLSYDGRLLFIRLSGAEKAVLTAAGELGGDTLEKQHVLYWQDLNTLRHPFFLTDKNIWRISVPPAIHDLALAGEWFYDWAGGLRWLKTDEPAEKIFALADQAQGHAVLFKNRTGEEQVFQPLSGHIKDLNRNIKQAFDPFAIFNPKRMYSEW